MENGSKAKLEREVRRMRLESLAEFNRNHSKFSSEDGKTAKNRLHQNLDRWEAFMRSQPEPTPLPPNPYKPPKTRANIKSRQNNK